MSVESFLSGKLRTFSVVDLGFVKLVYFLFGLLIQSQYPPLSGVDWWFYLAAGLVCCFPLYVHLFSQPGGVISKAKHYLKSNNPALQVLLFCTMFFFALMFGRLFPALMSVDWWLYALIMVVAAIKPLTKTWFW